MIQVGYVAGPYRNANGWDQRMNIEIAVHATRALWERGYAAICPHTNTAYFEGGDGVGHDEILAGDFAIVRKMDILFVLPGWQNSEGTKAEMRVARQCGIPIKFIQMADFHFLGLFTRTEASIDAILNQNGRLTTNPVRHVVDPSESC